MGQFAGGGGVYLFHGLSRAAMSITDSIVPLIASALEARANLLDSRHETSLRLFNGFFEGCPELVIDLYARTLVMHNYADQPEQAQSWMAHAQAHLASALPWINAIVVKTRNAKNQQMRRGLVTHGEQVARRIREHGVWYAAELLLNRDAGFYLDTRNLRQWALDHLTGKTVLNTFAYTGSLGIAAQAGGASRVVHLDRNREFLNVAKTSYTLNGFPIRKTDFVSGDYFAQTSRLRREGAQFDCVFVDPPFFAKTGRGTVNLVTENDRILNKVRPLVADGGYLVAVNNALSVSGAEYVRTLDELCADGYLSIQELISVPQDFIGYPQTVVRRPPVDPAPFNHSTKIVVLRSRRKA
jgi:23S rRNA (cytosine1962-C5)-methyltransferase